MPPQKHANAHIKINRKHADDVAALQKWVPDDDLLSVVRKVQHRTIRKRQLSSLDDAVAKAFFTGEVQIPIQEKNTSSQRRIEPLAKRTKKSVRFQVDTGEVINVDDDSPSSSSANKALLQLGARMSSRLSAVQRSQNVVTATIRRHKRLRAFIPVIAAPVLKLQTSITDVEDMEGTMAAFRIQRRLDMFRGVTRHWCQRDAHWQMLLSVLPKLYGRDWANRRKDILAFWGLKSLPRIIISMWARRWGKSTTANMFFAALTTVVGNLRIVYVAGSLPQAQLNIDGTRTALLLLPGGERYVCKRFSTSSTLCVTSVPGECDPDIGTACSIIKAVPTNKNTMRGRGDDIWFADEAAYIPRDFFFETLLPTLSREDVVAFLSTTQNTDMNNTISKMAHAALKNGPATDIYATWISTQCPKCALERVDCPHRKHWQPYWVTHESVSMLEKMYPDRATFEREMLGRSDERIDTPFQRESLELAAQLDKWDSRAFYPEFIFIFVDPALGGESNAAICAVAYSPNHEQWIVVGWDAHTTGSSEEIICFGQNFMAALRSRRHFRNSRVVLMVEGNNGSVTAIEFLTAFLGTAISRMNAYHRSRLANATEYLKAQKGSPPPLIWTKRGLCDPARELPEFKQIGLSATNDFWNQSVYYVGQHLLPADRLLISDNIVTTTPGIEAQFWAEMAALRRVPSGDTYTISGKATGQDDIAKATIACLYHAEQIRASRELAPYSTGDMLHTM
jgi:hypothetical protein